MRNVFRRGITLIRVRHLNCNYALSQNNIVMISIHHQYLSCEGSVKCPIFAHSGGDEFEDDEEEDSIIEPSSRDQKMSITAQKATPTQVSEPLIGQLSSTGR